MIGVGVDFGTSNSTVAWFDGDRLHFVAMESTSPILPTAVHLSREYVGSTGTQAIDLYVHENAARLVQMAPRIVGTASRTIEDRSTDEERLALETSRDVMYGPLEDHGLPGRLFLALKRLLANPDMSRLSVFGRPFRLVALLTPLLLRMRESVERELQGPVGHVHVGRPVSFEGGDSGGNALALERLTEACSHAGLRDIEFYPEPLAATLSFVWQQPRRSTGTVLTVDFGGGTLDLSVVRYAGVEFTVLATAGAALGGDRIDQLIYRRFLFPLLGEGETWARRVEGRLIETAFPFSEYEEGLLNWAITHTLNQNKYKARLTELIARGGRGSLKFERLKDLINYNYSYQVFVAIKRAKAQLSEVEATTIDIPELNLLVPITRRQFEEMLSDVLARLADLVDEVLADANLGPEDIDVVVRTGGSSQIVAVRHLLEGRFPGRVTGHDPFTSVAGGLALANYRGYHFGSGL